MTDVQTSSPEPTDAPEAVDLDVELADAGADQSAPVDLDREADIAADYIEELLDIADIDGDIDIEVRAGRTHLSIVSDGDNAPLEALVGATAPCSTRSRSSPTSPRRCRRRSPAAPDSRPRSCTPCGTSPPARSVPSSSPACSG